MFRLDDLQRDRDAELVIPRVIDRAHAADPEHLDDVVARPERADRQWAGIRVTPSGGPE